jgi:hypothetical protein
MHPLRRLRESCHATPAQVSALLAENVAFNSPILVRPIEGREVVAAIFAQSSSTRGSGTYTAEFTLDERTTFLRWVGTMDGHKIESLEVILDNEQGLIQERTVSLRPYPAVHFKLFRDSMYWSLKDKLPADVWDYSTPESSLTRPGGRAAARPAGCTTNRLATPGRRVLSIPA